MLIDRRSLLKYGALVSSAGLVPRLATAEGTVEQADYSLRIAPGLIELAPEHIVSTTLYNGQFPGPLLRFKEGQQVVIDVHNDTDTPELVHWHGQMIPSEVDGAAEEGTPFVPAHGMRRITFVPKPGGLASLSHARRRISTGGPTPARLDRSTSSRRTIPAPMTAKSFS
jgi:FtsP/CotA-like multicopper oxidase with cupredoxin domain